ncbi:sodium-dependent dopamine transporter-like [Haliotis rufescens]|uniref:sodium-dependent dopamine transporter-like n=1 Tax=Haliotis rufescens TaxID=6454 RepID=UPI00201F9921|nr:sodium-dependent dopamine transporter-like [Haliotis rufescens]
MLCLIFVGFAFFAIIGHVAYLRGVPVEAFESSGFNLAFIVYPEVMAYLPLPHVWSAMTFLALMTLEVDSMLPGLEIMIAAVEDVFRGLAKRRWVVICVILLSNFLFALPCTTQGGIYIVTLVDWYTYFPAVAVFAMLECFVVSWCYGLDRLKRDIILMWGKTVPRAMMLSVKYVCPVLLLAIFCYSIYSYRPPKYGDYIYPTWATGVGWVISSISIIQLPIVFIWTLYHTPGSTLREFCSGAEITMETNENFIDPATIALSWQKWRPRGCRGRTKQVAKQEQKSNRPISTVIRAPVPEILSSSSLEASLQESNVALERTLAEARTATVKVRVRLPRFEDISEDRKAGRQASS